VVASRADARGIPYCGLRSSIRGVPRTVRIDRGNRVDVYSWEGLVAFVLFTVGSLGMALTIKFDPLAPPETVMFRRSARWIGWFMGVGGWIGVWRLARVLLGKAPPP